MNSIKSEESHCLSDRDIKHVLGSSVPIILYPNLSKYSDIRQCFGKGGAFVIFFEEDKEGSDVDGHWECCFLDSAKNIIFFDSYGLKPDGCKKWLKDNQLMRLKEYPNYLTQLLQKAQADGIRVLYNPVRYQSFRNGNNECGWWVCARLLNKRLNGMQFQNFMENQMKQYNVKTFDEAVCEYLHDGFGI